MQNVVVTWIFSLMMSLAPPARLAAAPQMPGWEETEQQKIERYESIAKDLYEVVYDEAARPLYKGKRARATTAATILGIAFMESGFAHDVDKGPCYRGSGVTGSLSRCDGGLSGCLMQVRLGKGMTTFGQHGIDGKSQADLFADRKLCFRIGMYMVRKSFVTCAKYGPTKLLNVYASGSCERGTAAAKSRFDLIRRLMGRAEAPLDSPDLLVPIPTAVD